MLPYYVLAIPQVCIVAAIVVVLRAVFWFVNMLFIAPLSDPMRHLPGPEGSYFQSHIRQVMDPELSPATNKEWRTRYGKTFRFHGFGRHDLRLMSFDPKVVYHVLQSYNFEKPWQTRSFLSRLIGRGIFSSEGYTHTKQRRIVSPAFTYHSITRASAVFFRKADELCDRWRDSIAENAERAEESVQSASNSFYPPFSRPPQIFSAVIDVAGWMARASFDVIGLAGFGYDFHSLADESEEVYCAYRRMFRIADKGLGLWQILELYFPILRKIWVTDDIRTTNECQKIIAKAGKAIVAEKKQAFQDAQIKGNEGKDLLSLLIKSNLHCDESWRLTDQELLDQCSTFLLAGSDSVSVALSWCLYFLSTHPEVQSHLRKELNGAPFRLEMVMSDDSVDSGFVDTTGTTQQRWDDIASMPYLDCVVRETLRLCSPVHSTIRVAVRDDIIPIQHPVTALNGDIIGKDSTVRKYIKIRKGTYVHIPIEGFNLGEDQWGQDVLEFNPDRWRQRCSLDNNRVAKSGLMTFSYGPSSCLGYRFTIAEMKAFIATLVPQFEFAPAGDVKISKFNAMITRPYVDGKWNEGTQMPISIREL